MVNELSSDEMLVRQLLVLLIYFLVKVVCFNVRNILYCSSYNIIGTTNCDVECESRIEVAHLMDKLMLCILWCLIA